MALMIFSIWLMVEVPGNRAFPSSISPRIQPRLHVSTPWVYLSMRVTPFTFWCHSSFSKEYSTPRIKMRSSTSRGCSTDTDSRCSSQLIPRGSQQDLGSSVPSRCHVLRQCWIPTVLLDLVEGSGQAEVTQLDYTISVQQHIGRLWETRTRETLLSTAVNPIS